MPTCKQRDSQNRDKSDDDRKPRKLHIAAGEVGEVCGPGPDDDDRSPVIHLMDGPVEALADDNDRESEHQKWQSSDVPNPRSRAKKSPMFAPKMLARQSAAQYRAPSVGKCFCCMQTVHF